MKNYFLTVYILARMLTKQFFRDKVAMFFMFIFPLIFLLVFGSLNRNNNGASFKVVLIDNAKNNFSTQFTDQMKNSDVIKKISTEPLDVAIEQMSRGEVDTILVLPESFGTINEQGQPTGNAKVYFSPSSPQTGQTFASIVGSVFGEINQKITEKKSLFTVEQVSTDTKGLSSFDYIFAGLLGFSILSLGFFGLTNSLPSMKKEGILRRLRTTPLRTSQFVLGNALNYLLVGLLTVALLFVVGIVLFDFKMQGSYLYLLLFVSLGIIMMFGFGLAIGGWAKNENQAAPLSNLIAFPMMFLSGAFFPRFLMPEWLQSASTILPLTPLVEGIRMIITESKTIIDIAPQIGLMSMWTIVIYIIAFKVFRWE
jgi:ABC-2 type transport system permease protein